MSSTLLSTTAESPSFSTGKLTRALVSQAKTSLGVGLALAIGSIAWMAQFNTGPKINLDLSNFEWMSEVQISVAKAPVNTRPFWQMSEGDQAFAAIPGVEKEVAQISHRRHQTLVAFHQEWKRANPVMPTIEVAESSVVTSQAASVEAPNGEASLSELSALQAIHSQIQNQLYAALLPNKLIRVSRINVQTVDTQSSDAVTLNAGLAVEAPKPATETPITVPKVESPVRNMSTQVPETVSVQKIYQRVSAESLALQAREGLPSDEVKALASADFHDEFEIKTASLDKAEAPPLDNWDEESQDEVSNTEAQALNAGVSTSAAEIVASSDDSRADEVSIQSVNQGSGYSSQAGYSKNTLPTAPASTTPVTVAPKGIQALLAASDSLLADNTLAVVAPTLYGPTPDPSILSQPQVVEAFDWKTPISGYLTSQLTREGMDQSTQGWQVLHAPDHWSTVHYNSSDVNMIPMIKNNAAQILATKAGAELQTSAAIIFGKIPANWNVSLSGRAENVVILDSQNFPSGIATSGDRYFAFVNAAPGAHLVYLTQGAYSAAVGTIALGGAATYLDLTRINNSVITGSVADASVTPSQGMNGIKVSVVGQPSTTTVTAADGTFNLYGVFTVGNYPIYCESESDSGYVHRYRVDPTNTQNVVFYRMSPKQVGDWVGQLEGGVSPDSGLVVAAVKNIISNSVQKGLTPLTETLSTEASLSPETYALMPDGEIRDNVLLKDDLYRYVAVQVPEGANITKLEDNNQRVFWSELLFSSPGVINVIGH